ncbi:MAG: alpha/beta hydrolase [Synechococcus sp.]
MISNLAYSRWAGRGIRSAVASIVGSLLSALTLCCPTSAADRISIRASGGQRTIEVADLNFFATTGQIPSSLRWYASRLTETEIKRLREILQRPLKVQPRVVTNFSYDPVGETLLRRLGGVFWGGDPESNFKALRSALVLASYDDEGLTILNAVRKYPLKDLRINLDPALQASNDLQAILNDSRRLFAYIEQKGAIGPTNIDTFLATLSDPRLPGIQEWSKVTLNIPNPERDPQERLVADIYLPSNLDDPAPLVVISHGMASNRETFAYLARHLVSHGFAVASLEHPASDAGGYQEFIAGFAEDLDRQLAIKRPLDVTSLLNHLEQKSTTDSDWANKVRTDRVGVVGQSLGGFTALAVGGAQFDFNYLGRACRDFNKSILPFNLSLLLQCQVRNLPDSEYQMKDDRVAAIFAINPVTSSVFGPRGLGNIEIPVMMVAGTNDFFAPAFGEQIEPFSWLQTDRKYLVLVENGTHFSFLRENNGRESTFSLPRELIGPDPQFAHSGLKALATVFFHTHIGETNEYEPYLTEFSIPSRNGGHFNFALTRSLTEAEIEEAIHPNPQSNDQ